MPMPSARPNRRFRTLLFATALALPLAPRTEAQEIEAIAQPADVGMSADRLQRISRAVQRHIDAQQIAGAVTLVARNGRIVHFEAQGVMDVETKQPMTRDALFRMASTTKPVTAVAVMMLIEEGKVRLTDPVSKFIPEFKGQKVAVEKDGKIEQVPADREVQVRDLLTHTSGLLTGGTGQRQFPADAASPRKGDTLGDYVKRIASAPLDFQPGTRWAYSAFAGIDTLARIVEVASEKSYADFLRERIFEPLGMNDTVFFLPADREPRLASFHVNSNGALKPAPPSFGFSEPYTSGAAGLISSAPDFFRFAQMLANGGELDGKRILSPRGVELLSANHVGEQFGGWIGRPHGVGFGFTVEVVTDPVRAETFRSEGSYGWDGAFGTQFWVDPKERIAAVLLVQKSGVRVIQDDFGTAVMQAVDQLASPRSTCRPSAADQAVSGP